MKAILPAAGYATRMGDLTKDTPKPLLDIQGKPLIEFAISKLEKIPAVDEIIIVTNNKFYPDFLKWQRKFRGKKEISIINDGTNDNSTRLGSVRDVYLALENRVNSSFVVVNPDNLFTFDLNETYRRFMRNYDPVLGLFDVKTKEQASKLGNPQLDSSGKFIGFIEKNQDPQSTICTVGIYFFPSEVKTLMGEYLRESTLTDRFGDFIGFLVSRKDVYVYGHVFQDSENWFDIGSVEGFNRAQELKDIRRYL